MVTPARIEQLEKLCNGLDYEVFQDEVLMKNAKVGALHYGIPLEQCAPTFILNADETYVAVIIQGSRKLDFKKLRSFLGVKKVSMASPQEIQSVTGSPIGSVSLINPKLKTFIDQRLQALEYCYGGCGIEKFTLKIKLQDLVKIINSKVGDFSKAKEIP